MSHHDVSLLRILDAAANRAGEGLRVVEDYVRFVLDDAHLTGQLKELRHDLAATLKGLPRADLLASRDTRADVGVSLTTQTELNRSNQPAVVAANMKRTQQALRSLEEYGKVINPRVGAAMERFRYRLYTLERAIEITRASRERIAAARLYVLVDGRPSCDDFVSVAEALVEAGVDVLQLRDKRLTDRELIDRARALARITRGSRTLFVMNDRPDIARIVDADGVHLGQDELTVKDARMIIGTGGLIGVSTHTIQQARAAVLDGANYIGVGPTFASVTKRFEAHAGVELLREVSTEVSLPAFAIGGITLDNLDEVLATGIGRVAVGAAITVASDPGAAAGQFIKRLA